MKIPPSRLQRPHRKMSFASGIGAIRFLVGPIVLSMLVVTPAETRPASTLSQLPASQHATGIILFIGDGMGAEQRKAGRWDSVGQSGQLAMDGMPFQGWLQTSSANAAITDSAAAATAMATGQKTDNGHIGVDPAEVSLETILEFAEARGLATGLVTNVPITHATPASFAAHVPDRNMYTEIARQMIQSGVDVLLGGGEDEFLPPTETGCYGEQGERSDGRNLIAEAQSTGFTYVCDASGFAGVNTLTTDQLEHRLSHCRGRSRLDLGPMVKPTHRHPPKYRSFLHDEKRVQLVGLTTVDLTLVPMTGKQSYPDR
jgi:alkaline phosphatase